MKKKIIRTPHHNKSFGLSKEDLIQSQKRTCLGCGKKFNSSWIGNRLCKRCLDCVERND